jgi:hypothetical protein
MSYLRKDRKKSDNLKQLEILEAQLSTSVTERDDCVSALADDTRLKNERSAVYTAKKTAADNRITAILSNISNLKDAVNAHADYDATEKAEYTTALDDANTLAGV